MTSRPPWRSRPCEPSSTAASAVSMTTSNPPAAGPGRPAPVLMKRSGPRSRTKPASALRPAAVTWPPRIAASWTANMPTPPAPPGPAPARRDPHARDPHGDGEPHVGHRRAQDELVRLGLPDRCLHGVAGPARRRDRSRAAAHGPDVEAVPARAGPRHHRCRFCPRGHLAPAAPLCLIVIERRPAPSRTGPR